MHGKRPLFELSFIVTFFPPPLILLTNIYAGLTDIKRNKKGEYFKQIVIIILKLHITHMLVFALENFFILYVFYPDHFWLLRGLGRKSNPKICLNAIYSHFPYL